MLNTQSIDLLRKINARILIEISKLRKKFVEVEAENVKLKQIIEKNARHDVRVEELEQKNMELETKLQNNDNTKILKEKIMDAFLVKVNKKSISNKIRENLTHCKEDFSMTSTEFVTLSEQIIKKLILTCKSVISNNKSFARTSPVKSSMMNKQVLASENIETEFNDGKINKTFDIQISELSLKAILIGSSEVMVQNIVDLFKVTMKLRPTNTDDVDYEDSIPN
ncbi:hypothetical protein C1645_819213 [Glomus cerebriforme]|uniref:Uncharacterized protein n=1 Tax=Glomus cerebriforme TaxID=658196 RepID=A0A397T9L2_9GLOM|nr:hypothetical protein C1645_819213 [Glomus cerebriforme]